MSGFEFESITDGQRTVITKEMISDNSLLADVLARHDVRDRRHSNMDTALAALANCVADLTAYADNPIIIPGVAYSVAERLQRLSNELALFKARDLLSMRKLESS